MVTKASPAIMAPPHPNRRLELEDWISGYGLTWKFVPGAPIADIDVDRSLKNQARINPLDKETLERYEIAWRSGAKFPPIIVHRGSPTAKFLIVNGNHRLASAVMAEVTTLDRYELIGTDGRPAKVATVSAMCREANNFNGLPTSEEERILNAIFTFESTGIPLKEAARLQQVPLAKVQKEHVKTAAMRRAQKLGIDLHQFMQMSQTARTRLTAIKMDEIFKPTVELVLKANLGAGLVDELVKDINSSTSLKRQQAILDMRTKNYAERIQENLGGRKTNRSKQPPNRRFRLAAILGNIRTFDFSGLVESYSVEERDDLIKDLESATERLLAFVDEVRAPKA